MYKWTESEVLKVDELSNRELTDLAIVCKNFKRRNNRDEFNNLIKSLLSENIPKPIHNILLFLKESSYSGKYDPNKFYVKTYPLERIITYEQAIAFIISYASKYNRNQLKVDQKQLDLIKSKIYSLLIEKQDDLRINWDLHDDEICSLLGNLNIEPWCESEVKIVRRKVIKDWFKDIELDYPSDEQCDVISNTNNSLRVIARAGSGKTRTIAQKILFLVHFIGYSPDKILALAFNRKAKDELLKRVKRYETESKLISKGDFKVLTFDSLAYNLVKVPKKVLEDSEQKELIKKIVLNALEDEENLKAQVEKIILSSFKDDWEKILKLDKISTISDLNRLRSYLTEETLDQKVVKSRGEKRIADYFFEHDLPYIYEHPFNTDDGNVIRPDFYIPSPHRIIIEYCGLKGNLDYEDSLQYKRSFWEEKNRKIKNESEKFTLIEINPNDICCDEKSFDESRDIDYQFLTQKIISAALKKNKNYEINRLSDEEIILRLREKIRLTFVELVQSAITRTGQLNCSEPDLIDQINKYQPVSIEEELFLNLIPKFVSMYKDRMFNNNLIDYSEIKKIAIQKIQEGSTSFDWDRGRQGIDLKQLNYIFVDEFQDFSELFRGLLLSILSVAPQAKVNAVGDDWQMINRFAGSNPEFFNNFEKDYKNPKTLYLQTNYRSSGGIVDFCNAIMSSNEVQGKPALASKQNLKAPYSIFKLNRDDIRFTPREEEKLKRDSTFSAIFRLFKPLTKNFTKEGKNDDEKLLFTISRTNNPPLKVEAKDFKGAKSKSSRELINEIFSRAGNLSEFFDAITSHKSKGLESNTVIVLQPKQFPTLHKRSIFLRFFGDSAENLMRDELNLFYVTCSRAKNNICFLPEKGYMMTPFLDKIKPLIKKSDWKEYPCTLKEPKNLHTIRITEVNKNELFAAKEILIAYGFDEFSRPKLIPTRSKKVRMNFLNTLIHIKKISKECSKFKLQYDIYDGLNEKIYSSLSKKSLDQTISEMEVEGKNSD